MTSFFREIFRPEFRAEKRFPLPPGIIVPAETENVPD